MGKVKKPRRTKNVRKTELADNSDTEENFSVDSKENVIQTILDQIQVRNRIKLMYYYEILSRFFKS